ncbi:PepSY-associated TM helix domain-containing protein [Pedobacter suwonensis]|uniref:PepSY-associated TM helix domain-containing protein n=1 Tax=Pedobacter suwonensis TaxID=332999 RepID=UPI0011A108EB|nr:PepSY-associated TM helix domain-containing protein [Pedobacter suwonensis]
MANNRFKGITGWLHLWLGLITGLVLMVVALSGCLLTFEDELELVFFKERHFVSPSRQRLSADSIFNIANSIYPDKKVSKLILEAEPERSAEARIGKGPEMKVAYLNPYNGAVLYKGLFQKQFFRAVRNLHRYLLLNQTGKAITGISCCICLFLTISGIMIWWPANKKAIKQRFKIKWNAKNKRLNWDLHAVTGFYLSFFLILITLTGLVMSYNWAENLIYKLADGKVMKELSPKNLVKSKKANPGILQTIEGSMNKLYPNPGRLNFNISPKSGLAIMAQKESEELPPGCTNAAYFDGKTGRIIRQRPFASVSLGTKIKKYVLPVHAGSIYGLGTKILAFVVALFTASLPITGFMIWLSKRKKKKKPVADKRSSKTLATA